MADHFGQLRSWHRAIREAGEATLTQRGWYACYTRARHEKRVAKVLYERGIERYLPLVAQERQWHDRRKIVEFPLFPGYVFVRVARREVFDVTSVPSVVSMVMSDGRPALIRDGEIENVRRYAQALSECGEQPEPHPMISVGERVVVTDGPFQNVEGRVMDVRGRARIVVGIAALGQGFLVNVPVQMLRRLGSD